MRKIIWAALLAALLGPLTAHAHKPSDSYLVMTLEPGRLEGRWDIALRDLEHSIGLDGDGDGAITWGELQARHDAIASYALTRLQVTGNGQRCELVPGPQLVDEHTDGPYTVLPFSAACPWGDGALAIDYRLFADQDPLHRGLLRIADGSSTHSSILGPDQPVFVFAPGTPPDRLAQAVTYFEEGVWHIWIGFDHIIFLVTLLLPSVLRREGGRWVAAPGFRGPIMAIVKTVTAFTIAHSVTLTLAALGMVDIPSRLTESLIALSIVAAALNNIWPVVTRRIWALAFGFGLIHGLGFAGVLAELGLPQKDLLLSLVSFNVGVEAGQLAIVAVFLPLAFAFRSQPAYARVGLQLCSMLIAAIGSLWLVERAFDVVLLVT